MALTSALNMTLSGMMTTELKTSLSSQNIANADKEGYTRKSLNTQYITTNIGSIPVSGTVIGAGDSFLVAELVGDISTYSREKVVSDSLDYYNTQLGSTDGSNTLSTYIDQMYSTLEYLATTPETAANKAQVVNTAVNLANSLRDLSSDVQSLRQAAEHKIATSIDTINGILDRIDLLNEKVSTTRSGGDAGLADYEDQRNMELQKLGAELDIQYFYTSDNRLQVYTSSGQALLLSEPHHIDYTVTNVVYGTTLYPAGFSTIDLDGNDLTTTLRGGNLAGYIELRDSFYVEEQEKLDELATTLKTQINTILNTGASIPPRSLVEGTLQGLTPATAFTATGSIRVGVIDSGGTVVNYTDINLGAMATVNNVLTALNAVAGVTASLNADGELTISVAPTTNGIAINPLNSSVTSSTNESFSQYFGLNDMFTGTSGENINVNSYLVNNPAYLAVGVLSSSATLAAGDRGVARGDGSVADSLSSMLKSNITFNAAGNFAAQSNSLLGYAQAFMSDASTRGSIAEGEMNTTYTTYRTSNELLTSKSGVNIDEETAKMLVLQNQYEAGAQVVSTIQEMLDALMNAIR